MFSLFSNPRVVALFSVLLLASAHVFAAEISVKVSGIKGSQGQIVCSLFDSNTGFPMDGSRAKQHWLAADANNVVCKFAEVAAGSYAVSVGHDANGNKKMDTNMLGIPTEGWGVSNNVVPTMRAPKFDEAKFVVKEGSNTELDIKLNY